MKYNISGADCVGCGFCASMCPQVFSMVDGIAMANDVDIDDDKAEIAMEECPGSAISEA